MSPFVDLHGMINSFMSSSVRVRLLIRSSEMLDRLQPLDRISSMRPKISLLSVSFCSITSEAVCSHTLVLTALCLGRFDSTDIGNAEYDFLKFVG